MASAPLSMPALSPREAASGLFRLFRIEVRRSLGLLLFPVLVGIVWFAGHNLSYFEDTPSVALWPEESLRVSFASVLLAPVVAALLAWEAGRERRRRLDDLLTTTPRPPFARDLSRWAGTTAWALLTYVAVGTVMLIQTAQAATWGGPIMSALLMGLVVVPTAGALGCLAGTLVPSRFTPPLVAIGVYGLEAGIAALGPDDLFSDLKYLSPFALFTSTGGSRSGIFQEISPNLFAEASLWLIGLGAVALALVALRRSTSPVAVAALAVSLTVAAIGAAPLLATPKDYWMQTEAPAIPYQPVCSDATIPVCVHPAFESLLDEQSAMINTLAEPLAGVPGGWRRAEQSGTGHYGTRPDGTYAFHLFMTSGDFSARVTAEDLVQDRAAHMPGDCPGLLDNAQYAVGEALLRRAGWSMDAAGPGFLTCESEMSTFDPERGLTAAPDADATRARVLAAADRFATLSIEEQRAWFARNYAALRAGELTLDDLP